MIKKWRKSSASGTGNCVEATVDSRHVLVRDSKDRDGGVLTFTETEWEAFLVGVKGGEFDIESMKGAK